MVAPTGQHGFDVSGMGFVSISRLLTDGETPPLRLSENLMTKSSIVQPIRQRKFDDKVINLPCGDVRKIVRLKLTFDISEIWVYNLYVQYINDSEKEIEI